MRCLPYRNVSKCCQVDRHCDRKGKSAVDHQGGDVTDQLPTGTASTILHDKKRGI